MWCSFTSAFTTAKNTYAALYCAVVVNYINTQLCQRNCCWWRFRGHNGCSFTHQHDNTPVEDSSVVTVATGWAQERLLQDVTAAGKQTFNSWLIFFAADQAFHIPSWLFISVNPGIYGPSQTCVKERFNCILTSCCCQGDIMKRWLSSRQYLCLVWIWTRQKQNCEI